MEEQFEFDFNEVLNEFKNGKSLTGKDGLLAPLGSVQNSVSVLDNS
ncbi:hypothetical protein AAX26_02028 [Aliarcobacter thereius]|nr:hypothetical protein [Aliarcobacter thereius]OCL85356.1 hypothetical protein AAX26_02028 [Aliarcobacter thereius]